MNVLTSDLCARALIAAAVSFGEDPAALGVVDPMRRRRVLAAGALGLHHATQRDVGDLAIILGITRRVVFTYQNKGGQRFYKAAEQAEIASTHHLRANRPEPAVRVPTPSLYSTPRSRLNARARAAEAEWVKTLPPKPKRQRRAPRGSMVTTLDGGVQVIRLKPVTESVARHAKAQAEKGVAVDDLAELFDVDAESLERAMKALAA